MQLLGKLTLTGDLAEVRADNGVVLAEGSLVVHPGSQMITRGLGPDDPTQVASALQFSGKLTEAGLEAVGT